MGTLTWPGQILALLLPCLMAILAPPDHSSRMFNQFDSEYGEHICSGSSNGGSTMGATTKGEGGRLHRLRLMYENCSRVVGNLEISGVQLKDIQSFGSANFSFLSSIREVSGYVLISANEFRSLSIPNLRVIKGDRGNRMDHNGSRGYALDVWNNPNLEVLSLPALRVIQDRDVHLFANRRLCSWASVRWDSLFHDPATQRVVRDFPADSQAATFADCSQSELGRCSANCTGADGAGHCWGPGEDQCQDLYKDGCSDSCSSSRGQCWAAGGGSESCCHHSCVGGCDGPTHMDCHGCLAFEMEGGCVEQCPALSLLHRPTNTMRPNPHGRYAHRHVCVKRCPANMLVVDNNCVAQCPPGMHAPSAAEARLDAGPFPCVSCGDACPKTCQMPPGDNYIHAGNIELFTNCTYLKGSIVLRKDSFTESHKFHEATNTFTKTQGVTRKALEAMSSLRKVSGYIFVQSGSYLKDVDFLRNLEFIEGRQLMSSRFALDVSGNQNLRSLGLTSLKAVRAGDVVVHSNSDLCYIHSIDWDKILDDPSKQGAKIDELRAEYVCDRQKRMCDSECDSAEGCWGPGPAACVACRNFTLGGACVGECRTGGGQFLSAPAACEDCHPECAACDGIGPRNCTRCRHKEMEDGECVAHCPASHFARGHHCLPCHEDCHDEGCSGPSALVGAGGCRKCVVGLEVVRDGRARLECVPDVEDNTQLCVGPRFPRHYAAAASSSVWHEEASNFVCLPCDEACESCRGAGSRVGSPSFCSCASHQVAVGHRAFCSFSCPENSYPLLENTSAALRWRGVSECGQCHAECASKCRGPTDWECEGSCVHLKQLASDGFQCVLNCSEEFPFEYKGECTDVDMAGLAQRRLLYVLFGVAAGLLILLALAVACFLYRHKFITLKRQYTEIELPDAPGYRPNMSRLRIIKACELRRGGKLGEGAFGVVFRGVYRPEGETVKVPVAIKQLTRSSPETEKEMLEEATHMGSLSHPHLVRLVGISVSQKILLVTPLMPLGNLRDYIKNNQGRIGSHAILKWSHQIAQGMEHLEENRLVHRDLAARNVLVRNPGHVAVTDFGLAKMLDYGEKEVFVEGRVPVKWLALESIEQRRFTHKSDVWAYGVTVWEILSFGKHPYESVPIQSIPKLLREGERLEQPATCSLNLYMLLIRCWVVDAGSRPSFGELVLQVGEFLKTPSSYVTIANDKLLRLPSATEEGRRFLDDALLEGDGTLVDPNVYFDASTLALSQSSQDPTSPTSPSAKPLMWGGSGAGRVGGAGPSRHSSVGSRRYQSDPLGRGGGPVLGSTLEEDVSLSTDADNYLTPNSQAFPAHPPPDYSPQQPAYTKLLASGEHHPPPTYYNTNGAQPGPQEGRAEGRGEVAMENMEYLAPDVKSSSRDSREVTESETVV